MSSRNGRIVGRVDRLNSASQCVIDYKSGGGGPRPMSDQERRQLRLYVHLAIENGVKVSRGMIVRGSGQQLSEPVSAEQAAAEAKNAEDVLDRLNERIEAGETFTMLGNPSPGNCSDCPCMPLCPSFWERSSPEWREAVGCHAEGRVTGVQESTARGVALLAITMNVERGTVEREPAFVQAFPLTWIVDAAEEAPQEGSTVRIVNARVGAESPTLAIFVDRAGTSIWILRD